MEVLFAWEDFWEGSSRNCDELASESENKRNTRKGRIDPRLDALGWKLWAGVEVPINQPYRTEEEEAGAGPADYGLWLNHKIVGLVEAKKLTLGPQNVLTQAERDSRGFRQSWCNFDG